MALNDNLLISLDWLQLYCSGQSFELSTKYTFKEMPYQTKQFRQMFEVYYHNEEFAQIQLHPVSVIIPQDAVIVKFKNRQLYGSDIITVAQIFLADCKLVYKSITRLDLAVDFNKFANGLLPHTFIKKFLSSDILKVGQGKYTLIGEQRHAHTYDYIRFGSKTSAVNTYLYNKTKELAQVQDKPYIRKKWLLQGLDLTLAVWRLEVSVKSEGKELVNYLTGEVTEIEFSRLNESDYLSAVYFSYLAQYFRFVINDGQKNKTRMKQLILFSHMDASYKPIYLPKEHGANRADKIFCKKLYQLDQELRGMDGVEISAINQTLTTFIRRNNLTEYVAKRSPMWLRSSFKPS